MTARKHPPKKIAEKLKKLETEPEEQYGFIEESIWYPNERFIEEAHNMLLKEYGGHIGYETGINLYQVILKHIRETQGIYKKAAVLLRKLATRPCIYQDGNHRLALLTTETFLNKNNKKIWTRNSKEAYIFIKNILCYNTDEIAEWLKNGPKKRTPHKNPENSNGKER
jgi:prophage maintenance system killer protein